MGEKLPHYEPAPGVESDLEQLADWIMRHEALASEHAQASRQGSAPERTEIEFETRHEIKDEPTRTGIKLPSLKPMVSVAAVLEEKVKAQNVKAKVRHDTSTKQKTTRQPSYTAQRRGSYRRAVRYGVGIGVAVVVATGLFFAIKQLALHL